MRKLALVALVAQLSMSVHAATIPQDSTVLEFVKAVRPDASWQIAVETGQQGLLSKKIHFADGKDRTFAEWLAEASKVAGISIASDPKKIILISRTPRALNASPAQGKTPSGEAKPATAPADPSAIMPAVAATPPKQAKGNVCWEVRQEDGTLRGVFERWAREAGWQPPAWELRDDFVMDFYASYCNDDFVDAVQKVINQYSNTDNPINATFYQGNRVLVISSGAK